MAEEVANTTFLRLINKRPAVKSSFIGLVLRIARNLCRAARARQMADRRDVPRPDDPVQLEPAADLERREQHRALEECLDRLSPRDRTLAVLHDAEGLTFR